MDSGVGREESEDVLRVNQTSNISSTIQSQLSQAKIQIEDTATNLAQEDISTMHQDEKTISASYQIQMSPTSAQLEKQLASDQKQVVYEDDQNPPPPNQPQFFMS